MAERLVTIASFVTPMEAQLAKSTLELEGIPSFVFHEFSAAGGIGTPNEPVKLQVPESVASAARSVLKTGAPPGRAREFGSALGSARSALEANEERTLRCLICQSSLVSVKEPALPLRILRAILLQIIPLPEEWFEASSRKCGVCGHEWKPS